jgi:HlyD family secretion protein
MTSYRHASAVRSLKIRFEAGLMNILINRLDPHLPDPVESRRRSAGRLVRIAYATGVFGILGFFVIYFGAPFVFLGGPGTVSSPRYVISLPYTVQISRMSVTPGATVKAGDEIGQVHSPEQDSIVATHMRSLADIVGRSAELRVKARVARDSLEAARSYQRGADEALERIAGMSNVTATFRIEILRERALASKSVISQEAEVDEATSQLASLDAFGKEIRERLDDVERNFSAGRIPAPIGGIISTGLAYTGQSLVAGAPIAEILDPNDVFVDWYVPNERLIDPKVGNEVLVLFGRRRIPGTIAQILPVSAVYAGTQQQVALRDRPATQIARVRFNPGSSLPPLNSTVYVHMHYTRFSARIAERLIAVLGLD